ncbi:glutathione S-transferase [Thozetella sp. PMI_491]|nr:glutathione S-transferase [Thozetella sp. PMI_491]
MDNQAVDFYSHREGPNPWKNVIVFEELGIAYKPTYLEFGADDGGVQHEEFLKKNPAGRVPWIKDPATGQSFRIELTESNLISQYLTDHYDTKGVFKVEGEQDELLVRQWLGFQAASQGPFFAQALIAQHVLKNEESTKHFQALVKRTITTVNRALEGKEYLVGGKITLADLSFIPWDMTLDAIFMGDSEAATAEGRKQLWPNWYKWHQMLLLRPAVQKMVSIRKTVQKK